MNNKQFVQESKEIAINALKNFIKNLGVNEEAFNHIYEIPIKIDNIGADRISEYDHFNNTINISKPDLEEYQTMIKVKKVEEIIVKLNIATAIIHEMIHANRTIQINDKENDGQFNIVSEFYHKNNNRPKEYQKQIKKGQTSFEELITDALSQIIILNRKKEIIDLDKTNQIIQENEEKIGTKIASQILTNIGLKNIKWFMISVYDEVYDDKFAKIFQEEYENLLADFNILEYSDKHNEYQVNYSANDAHRIIKAKTRKKR